MTHRLAEAGDAVTGRVLPHLLHLGSFQAGSGANGPEVDRILLAINKGWRTGGKFWTSAAMWQSKRLVFMGLVLAAAVSGAEAIVLGIGHARRIDASICKKLRCMLQGKAHIEDEEGGHYSLPSIDVWRECKLAPYALETCVRRLKWWQNIVA